MAAPRRIVPIIVILAAAAALTIAVGAIVLSANDTERPSDNPQRVAVPDPERRLTPAPSGAPAEACQATVGGSTVAAVDAAVASAGAGTVCFPAGRYEGPFAATVAGQTWRIDHGAVLRGSISIQAPDVWIEGGTIELPTDNQFGEGIGVYADRATIHDVTFHGGGIVISIKGRDGTQVLDNRFDGQSGTAIFIWGEGLGADDTLIEGNTIKQSAAKKASPIASRAAEDISEGILNQRITVRGNTIDQGDETTGWFGVELKLSPGAVIVDNDIRGGGALISLPDSDGVIVSGNRLDLRGSAVWGVEIAKSNDVTVEDNTFIGDGPGSEDAAVSMSDGSLRVLISANNAAGLGTLVNLTGDDHVIADNCLANVTNVIAYRSSAGPNVNVARNGPCEGRTTGRANTAFAR